MSKELSVIPNMVSTLSEVQNVAESISASKMYGLQKDQAIVLMLLSEAKGLRPVEAITRYHLIPVKGMVDGQYVVTGFRPSMSSNAMLAAFQQAGGSVEWHSELTDPNVASATFTHHKYCSKGVRATLTMKQLDELGVSMFKGSRKDVYKQNPDSMLRARLISKVLRAIAPAILEGMYAPEELADIDNPTSQAAEVTQVSTPERAPRPAPIQDAETEQAPPRKPERPVLPEDIESRIVECILNAKDLDEILAAKRLAKGYRATDEQISKIKRAEEEVSAAITSADASTKFDRAMTPEASYTLDQLLDELTRSPKNAAAWAMKSNLSDDDQAAFDVAFREAVKS